MQQIPNRIKIEMYELGGKYQAVSKYCRTGFYDTEQQALDKHKILITAYRQAIKSSLDLQEIWLL